MSAAGGDRMHARGDEFSQGSGGDFGPSPLEGWQRACLLARETEDDIDQLAARMSSSKGAPSCCTFGPSLQCVCVCFSYGCGFSSNASPGGEVRTFGRLIKKLGRG